jgi:BolA protein
MTRAARITHILTQALAPSQLELRDESHKHAGHAGASPAGETHYRLVIASAAFEGKSRVAAHQAIYALLADEFTTGLHALAIELKR